MASMRGRRRSTTRGVKAPLTRARRRVWAGGSRLSMSEDRLRNCAYGSASAGGGEGSAGAGTGGPKRSRSGGSLPNRASPRARTTSAWRLIHRMPSAGTRWTGASRRSRAYQG